MDMNSELSSESSLWFNILSSFYNLISNTDKHGGKIWVCDSTIAAEAHLTFSVFCVKDSVQLSTGEAKSWGQSGTQ